MKKRKIFKGGDKQIFDYEQLYQDKNSIALINLIAEIVVEATLSQLENKKDAAPNATRENIGS